MSPMPMSPSAMEIRRSANPSRSQCIKPRRCRTLRIRRCSKGISKLSSSPMNKASFAAAAVLLMLLAPRSWGEFVVEVTKGQDDAIPIAIVPFTAADAAADSFDVAQVVSADLSRSGRFKSMDRKDMVEQPHTGANIGFEDWRRLGNDYI